MTALRVLLPPPLPALKHMRHFSVADFGFTLPPELIAQHPAAQRSASRLLDGRRATPVDRVLQELPRLLQPGDLLVFNAGALQAARVQRREHVVVARLRVPAGGPAGHQLPPAAFDAADAGECLRRP